MIEHETQVDAVLRAYAAAVYAKDVEAFVGIHDAEVHVFDTWGGWEMRGAEALRGMATEWFGSLGEERVVVEMSDVGIVAAAEVAWTHAAITFMAESASGERSHAIANRATMCLAKRDGGWKIVHEHTSLPVDMETMTAIRER